MGQKEDIISLLQVNGTMTQGQLAEAIYGDKLHTSNIYSSLMLLVNNNVVIRTGAHPSYYSLGGTAPSNQTLANKHNHLFESERFRPQPQCIAQQGTITISAEQATQLIKEYYNETIIDTHGRYLSWEHCFKAFSENRNIIDEQTLDYLSLHLAFYLASWGMYRGSSFLLQKDYKVHIPIVRIVQEEKYNPLFGISAENLCEANNLTLLNELGARIRKSYADEKPAIDGSINKASDTLVTKILLGTLGCVPAYDRYYVQSVKKYHISGGTFNKSSVYSVAKFYCDNLDEFEKLRFDLSKRGIEYPPMKLMDMCFWQDAYIDDFKKC